MRISRNMCIDSIRQRKRLPIVVDSEGNDILNNIGIFEKSQEDLHIENDEITMLRKWIWELPEEQREVLVLRNYADLSFKEIAVITNTNINTIGIYQAMKFSPTTMQGQNSYNEFRRNTIDHC
jgi:RNA polymerase sigma-70 factor (ECF subfamily)